ncbi:hypothetical protein [Streptomyces halstedii]|uniref:hypothetical protein n=1 Tax=Streptomyces halstedii TaxID=1944 RepID=UPI00335D5ED6
MPDTNSRLDQILTELGIAGHDSPTTTQRHPHPDACKITAAEAALSAHFGVLRRPHSPPSPIVMTPLTR